MQPQGYEPVLHLLCVPAPHRRRYCGLSREIRRLPKSRVAKIAAQSDCVLCGQAIPVRTEAYVFTERAAYAHQECLRLLREKVEELAPRPEAVQTEWLPFGEKVLEIE
jgi:hypothetical protein